MPKLTYKPEGEESQSWEFTFGRITLGEMASIQRLTKMSWDEVKAQFFANDVIVVHALLYTFLKRANSGLRPTDLEFFEDDYDLALTEAEIREEIAAMSDGEVRQALIVADERAGHDLAETDRLSIDLLRQRAESIDGGTVSAGPKAVKAVG